MLHTDTRDEMQRNRMVPFWTQFMQCRKKKTKNITEMHGKRSAFHDSGPWLEPIGFYRKTEGKMEISEIFRFLWGVPLHRNWFRGALGKNQKIVDFFWSFSNFFFFKLSESGQFETSHSLLGDFSLLFSVRIAFDALRFRVCISIFMFECREHYKTLTFKKN